MNRQEHLLVILSEECAELSKEVSKALRFGLNDHEPLSSETNAQRMVAEFNDLVAVFRMLAENNIFNPDDLLNDKSIQEKKEKVELYLTYSKIVGTLS